MKDFLGLISGLFIAGIAFGLCLAVFVIPSVYVISYIGRLVGACS